jgi:hypothetical protein
VIRIGVFCSVLALLVFGPAASAGAADQPPRVGSVSCGATGNVRFGPRLHGGAGSPSDKDAHAKFKTAPAGCSGSQTGGNPHRPGPVDHGKLLAKGFTTGRTCSSLTAHGLHSLAIKITWFDASGASLGVTKVASGSATVSGLGNGVPSSFPPPDNPSPGIVTFTVTGTVDPTSKVFPGGTLHATFVGDQTTDNFALPCSNDGPPLPQGLHGFVFSGVNGPSTISVS